MPDPFDSALDAIYTSEAPDARAGRAAPRWPFLAESWRDPDAFFRALVAQSEALLGAGKTRHNLGYDAYHDAVVRHLPLGARRTAVRFFDGDGAGGGWQGVTLGALHARATEVALALRAREVEPGVPVALVLPVGETLFAALLAALRIGACVSIVPPVGPTAVADALAALKPALVVTMRPYTALRGLLAWDPLILPEAGRPTPAPAPDAPATAEQGSSVYAADAPMFALRSPLQDPDGEPVLLPGAAAYQHALRDGLAVYRLRPGDVLAVPAAPLLQYQPAALLAALLCGAELLLLHPEGLRRDPGVLLRTPIRTVVLDAELREALLDAAPPGRPRWGRYFTNPEEPPDTQRWEQLSARLQLDAVPRGQLLVDAAAGGALVFAEPGRAPVRPRVVPVPGLRFELIVPASKDLPALGTSGALSVLLGEELRLPGLIALGRSGDEYLYAGAIVPRRVACAYPASAARAVTETVRGVLAAAVVPVANAETPTRALFVVVVFTGAQEVPGLPEAVFDAIELELGPDARPDRVEAFALYPRMGKEGLDLAWVQSQYLRSVLHQKARSSLFRLATALRGALTPAPQKTDARDEEPHAEP